MIVIIQDCHQTIKIDEWKIQCLNRQKRILKTIIQNILYIILNYL